jgi:peptidoglycan DL-endopeptidase CwlO
MVMRATITTGISKIKTMKKLSHKPFKVLSKIGVFAAISLLVIGALSPNLRKFVLADSSCSSISDCQQQITNGTNAVNALQSQATSYQDAINILQSQISSIQAQISINQTRQAQLQAQIVADQAELAHDKVLLGDDLKAMYVSGSMTTVEMLATSKSLSDFVDAETYDSAVQNKIQDTLNQITALTNQLQEQKNQVDQLLATQQAEQNQLAAAQAQQQQLLAYNQSQQDAYTAQVSQNEQKLAALIAAQRAANDSNVGGGYYFIHFPGTITADPCPNGSCGSTAYPYAHMGFEMNAGPGCTAVDPGDGPDPYGECMRQCVSYAAWAVAYSGRQAPVDWGNANDWVPNARAAGIPFDVMPQVGDVAIDVEGYWGHAMYVEGVSGNQILVSEYNQQLTGEFSTQWRTWE